MTSTLVIVEEPEAVLVVADPVALRSFTIISELFADTHAICVGVSVFAGKTHLAFNIHLGALIIATGFINTSINLFWGNSANIFPSCLRWSTNQSFSALNI